LTSSEPRAADHAAAVRSRWRSALHRRSGRARLRSYPRADPPDRSPQSRQASPSTPPRQAPRRPVRSVTRPIRPGTSTGG